MVSSVVPRRSFVSFSVLTTQISSPSSGIMRFVPLPTMSGSTSFMCR